jgi:nitrite reductase/ring-hydroxylating ferredoxin subunit
MQIDDSGTIVKESMGTLIDQIFPAAKTAELKEELNSCVDEHGNKVTCTRTHDTMSSTNNMCHHVRVRSGVNFLKEFKMIHIISNFGFTMYNIYLYGTALVLYCTVLYKYNTKIEAQIKILLFHFEMLNLKSTKILVGF